MIHKRLVPRQNRLDNQSSLDLSSCRRGGGERHELYSCKSGLFFCVFAFRTVHPSGRDHEAQTLFDVRDDETIFVSVASYRDENCPTTLKEMFSKAHRPENVFIGLVQQVLPRIYLNKV